MNNSYGIYNISIHYMLKKKKISVPEMWYLAFFFFFFLKLEMTLTVVYYWFLISPFRTGYLERCGGMAGLLF